MEFKCDIGMNKRNYKSESRVLRADYYDEKCCIDDKTAIEYIYNDEIFVAVWNKIYNLRFIRQNGIKFSEDIWYGEGRLFNIEILQFVDTVSIGEKAVYHQTYNPDSAMRKFNLESNLCGIRSMDLQKTLWQKRTKEIEDQWLYHRYRFNRSIASGLIISDMVKENRQIYKECMRNLRKNISLPMRMEKNIKAKLGWVCFSVCPTIMVKRSMQKIKKAQTNRNHYIMQR